MHFTVQLLFLVIASVFLSDVLAVDVCTSSPYTYCEDGYHCCVDNTRCCFSAYADTGLAIGAIIGIVIGCIIFISCCVAVICCVVKKNHRPGQVIQPAQQPGVAIIATGHQQGQPVYGQPQYGVQQTQGVNKAGPSDPAYPPPPPAY